MTTTSKDAEQKQQHQQAKNGYWQNELDSLGIVDPEQKKKELNDDDDEELEKLADILSNKRCFRIIK
jgi:hypothetical protein